jgi:hypothetical protein
LKPWLLGGIAAVALIVVGASGLFAYRAIFTVGSDGTPPVTIRPEAGPTKLVPGANTTKAADSGGNKQIYDRVGGESAKTERIVSREERPIETAATNPSASGRTSAGTVTAAAPPAPTSAAQSATTPGAAPAPVAASTEPRRVRTVTVRADGSVVNNPSGAAPVAAATPGPQRTSAPATGGNSPLALNNPSGTPSRPSASPPSQSSENPWANVSGGTQTQAALPPPGAAPTNPAPIVAVNTPAPAGSYVVQVAAQKSEAEAASTWQQLQQRYPAVLGGQQASIRRVDLGERGVFYRAQVGPFGSRAQASEVCQSLKAAGGECVIQRN